MKTNIWQISIGYYDNHRWVYPHTVEVILPVEGSEQGYTKAGKIVRELYPNCVIYSYTRKPTNRISL